MAKRKRLSPAQNSYLAGPSEGKSPLSPGLAPSATPAPSAAPAPIAQVAGAASSQAALQELSDVLTSARAKGLMVEELALDSIDEAHLVRDRISQDEEEMEALMRSLRARGQQSPIEVVPLQDHRDGKRWGLISGWRRLTALRRLYAEGSEPEFARIKALVIRPESAEAAYVAMVEENEIRVNLSHYERARIAVRALSEGVFPSQRKALQELFANVPRSKRSKIGSFVTLVEALDAVLYFPTAISEKLGLALVRRIGEDAAFLPHLVARLTEAERQDAAEELALLQAALDAQPQALKVSLEPEVPGIAPSRASAPTSEPEPAAPSFPSRGAVVSIQLADGLRLEHRTGSNRIGLSGQAVDEQFLADLKAWIRQR